MTKIDKKEIEEFINAAVALKQDSYEDFIKIKSLAIGILIGKNKRDLYSLIFRRF